VRPAAIKCRAVMLNSAKLVAFAPTTDFDKARSFYEGVLGLKFVALDGFALVMDANGTRIRIAKVGKFTPAQFTILGWDVQRIDDVVSDLEKKGVKFERFPGLEQDKLGVWTAPGGARVAWFKDPDGNILSISEQ
jgi:catechol 2,3-dioxygenase-like lactoylglutathione lyase family enzyme